MTDLTNESPSTEPSRESSRTSTSQRSYSQQVEAAIVAAGYQLPAPPEPVAAYVPARRCGRQLFISGQLPFTAGQLLAKGLVDSQVDDQLATEAARQCTLNALAIVRRELDGRWERLAGVVRVGCFVASDPTFTQHSMIANGASELLVAILGERGRHARAAVGVAALPLGAAVEVEYLFEVTD